MCPSTLGNSCPYLPVMGICRRQNDGVRGDLCRALRAAVEGCRTLRRIRAVRTGTAFAFGTLDLVSAAIESRRTSLPDVHAKPDFEPLGMNDTRPDSATGLNPGRATPYFPRFAADPRYGLHLMREIDYSCYAGSSAFLSTPSDLVRFAMAINSGTLLQPATVQLLQTSQRLASGQETGYGLGWDLETVTLAGEPTRVVGHDGDSLGGMVTSLMIFRERGIVVAVTSNISYADTFSLATGIAQAFAGK